ncbi:transglutaminase-like domain-containing protein [Nannocystaceae bacterium ST9]
MLATGCPSVPPGGDEGDSKQPETASEIDEQGGAERILAIQVSGQTLGMVETRLDKAADGTWTTHERVTFSMTRQGGGADATFNTLSESTSVFDPQHEFVSELEIEREAGVTVTRRIRREGDTIISEYEGPDRKDTREFKVPDDYRSSLAVYFELLARWRETGKPTSAIYSSFSAERERFEKVEVDFLGEANYEYAGKSLPGYSMRERSEDGTVITSIVDHDFVPMSLDASGTFMAAMVDEPPVLGAASPGGGTISAELPVSGTTEPQWWTLGEQKIAVTVEGDVDPQSPDLWEDNHYHQVERSGEGYAMTLTTTRPGPGFKSPALPMTVDAEIARFLEPTAMAQSDNPAIQSLAREIVGSEKDAMKAAEKIIAAVFHGIAKEAGARGSATATEVLRNGAGDCTEHAVLVVALMRAAGIPARVVDGIVLAANEDGTGVAGYHAWAEIWLGRWVGVDGTVGETGTSARYLEFGIDEPGQLGSGGKMMRAIGKTKIELGPHKTLEELGLE